MPKFEVYLPAATPTTPNITLRVQAENWMSALKAGLAKLGETGELVKNVLVDIQDDDSIHVTDPSSARVFRIRELSEAEVAAAAVKRPAPPAPPAAAVNPFRDDEPTVRSAAPLSNNELSSRTTLREMPAVSVPAPPRAPAAARPARAAPSNLHQPSEVLELERPVRPVTKAIGRPAAPDKKKVLEDLLAEIFEKVQEIEAMPVGPALGFLLDLAIQKVPAESGSVYLADAATGDLSYAVVRGPKAVELLAAKLVIPSGTGLVGFSAVEGVSVAVSDVEKDPRFYKDISERLRYEVRSVLTCPMMTDGQTFGCFQLMNKAGNATFDAPELGILSYLAHQAAQYLSTRS